MNCRYAKMTRQQIADKYGVTLAIVRRWIEVYDLAKGKVTAEQRYLESNMGTRGEIIVKLPHDYGITKMEKVKDILGNRLVEKRGSGFFLDGRPCKLERILREAGLE